MAGKGGEWDVFISHASEDKEAVALPLAGLLERAGLRVWLDKNELSLGDSLRLKIDAGLAGSRFGVVILSERFFAKKWPNSELDSLFALEEVRGKVLLPVLHGIEHSAVARFSPLLAGKLTVSTARGLPHVAQEIIAAARRCDVNTPPAAPVSFPDAFESTGRLDPGTARGSMPSAPDLSFTPIPSTAGHRPAGPPDTLKKVLFWFAVQLPLAGVILAVMGGPPGVLRGVEAHPGRAIAVVAAYQGFVLGAGILKRVWENLEPDVVNAVTGFTRSWFLRLVSRFRRHYLRQVIYDHRLFNVRGLRTQGTYALKLNQVFVELRIAPNAIHQARIDLIDPRERSGSRPVWEFLRQIANEEAQALAIVGAPGSGKTTLLQHIALTLAANRQRRHRIRAYVPILLFLRDLVPAIASPSPPSLGALAQVYFSRKPGYPAPPPGWFERELLRGGCLVLLDGLDEVANDDQRLAVSAWVDEQIRTYSRSPFILTARPNGYRAAPLQGAHVLEVQPFSPEQTRAFIHNWYLANEIMRFGGQVDPGVHQQADAQAMHLIQRLRERPGLVDLTRNPLLLTMIATVHSYRGALPGRRVELYDEICDVLLGHWHAARGVASPLTATQLRSVLEPLAAHMMHKRTRELRTAEALAILRTPLERVGVTGGAVDRFLPDLQAKSGLFLERESDRWAFAHLTFQEYLASARLRKQSSPQGWPALIQSTWWMETLRLYAVQGDATPLLKACLAMGSVQALMLAIDVLEEASEIEHAVRREAEQLVIANLEAEDPELRRKAAEVHLARRLRSMHPIDERREIDLHYVTFAEYQLFLDEMRAQGRCLEPDHWAGVRFPSGQARAPVSGVRGRDADEFTQWLNVRYAGDAVYRLPTVEEIEAHHAEGSQAIAAWCNGEGSFTLAGLESGLAVALTGQVRALSPSLPLPPLDIAYHAGHFRAGSQSAWIDYAIYLALDRDRRARPSGTVLNWLEDARGIARILAGILREIDRTVDLEMIQRSVALGYLKGDYESNERQVESSRFRPIVHVREIDAIVMRALALGQTRSRSEARELGSVIESAHQRASGFWVDCPDIGEARALAFQLMSVLDFARHALSIHMLALDLAREFVQGGLLPEEACEAFTSAIEQRDLERADRVVRGLAPRPSHGSPGVTYALLSEVLELFRASTPQATRRAARNFAINLLEYRFRRRGGEEEKREDELRAYWFLRAVIAREAGALPAWEGIRLVRERPAEASA